MKHSVRSFLAILLSEETRKALAKCTADLKSAAADVRWVEEDNFHITLSFLGDIDSRTCDSVIRRMPEITPGIVPFELSLYRTGAFPNLKKPRVIWAGVSEGRREIIKVHKRVLTVIQSFGFTEEKRFSPHVTLGRVRSSANLEKLIPAMEKFQHLGKDYVHGISLMESTLTPKGAVYSELAFFKFKSINSVDIL